MAFSGLVVACGFAGRQGSNTSPNALLLSTEWSEAPASGVTSSNVAPARKDEKDGPIFSVIASADSFIAIGPQPNASTGARRFVLANQHYDFFATPGDRFVWVAA